MPNPSNALPPATTFSTAQKSFRQHGRAIFVLLFLLAVVSPLGAVDPAPGQAATAPAPAGFAMADLRPVLANVQNAITAANVARWKVPGSIKANTQQDVASMQRDLATTLPGLLSTAESAPATNGAPALAPTFAVFRNLDALYDVLLRVSQVASIGAPAPDADSLESARAALENSRASLGTWLLQAIGTQDTQLAQAAAAAAAKPPPPPPPPTKIVVEDGPDNPKPRKKKAAAPPAPQ